MSKIGLMVCGNSGIDYINVDYPVKVIHSTLNLGDKEYEDYVDITAETFYNTVVSNPDIAISTSQTPTGKIAEVYEEFKKEGYTSVIAIMISSKLSGTYQGAVLASTLVEGLDIHVIDSKSVSHGEYYLVQKAIEMIKAGKKAEEIKETLEQLREKIRIMVLVDTLKYLVKNGRLSATSGFLGTLLKIKPLLHVTPEGALVPLEKIRTTSKARERLLEILIEETKNKKVDIFLAYTNNKIDAEHLKNLILEQKPDVLVELVPLTPVVGAHAGPGTIGVGYIER
ncbi:DegV family protein with EDD domain [Acholeplasma morum]|uniref:DegV family protein n=1 Tax=Paracholeplasma morum TaxID=264637 RepID=UPI001959E33E|nr:DegV family protein [Paracholeplasma morum]MBM7452954.1 DegV family protein with EDD domain [Paracholeplasma morum]